MNEEDQIKKVIEDYFYGTYSGDEKTIRQAFHSDVKILGIIKGNLFNWSLSDFLARVTEKPTAKEKDEKLDKKIIMIDITGNSAMVKAEVFAGGLNFTDYITLLKVDGKWSIRFKSFYAE